MNNLRKPVSVFQFVLIGLFFIFLNTAIAQVEGTHTRHIRIGELQNQYTAYGSERAWNNNYYEGLRWPADYPYTDNAVIERFWYGARDFVDPDGKRWDAYTIHSTAGYVGNSIFPIKHEQTAKFEPPTVLVDGVNVTGQYLQDIDDYDPDQIPDRIITNVVNSSMGLTMTRRILAFSQQYHDDYHIREYTFTNTGKTGYGDQVRLRETLKDVYVSLQIRYSVSREGSFSIGGSQSWGQHTWVTRRGENYPDHAGQPITENNPIVDWLRAGFAWAGQNAANSWDNIGGPHRAGDGRLRAVQHAGFVVLHVDKSGSDKSDDPNQPFIIGWHAGDTYPSVGDMSPAAEPQMRQLYAMLQGQPHQGLGGNDRMDEVYLNSHADPSTVHNDRGGTNLWYSFGPFTLEPDESVTIVMAEGVSGLGRQKAEEIGRRWKQALDDPSDTGPFTLPDGSTTNDKELFKNQWTYTGKDSIMQTFGRAYRNFMSGYNIPKPPIPPPVFDVSSGGDRITLTWAPSSSAGEPGFAGYRIYRAVGKPDTTYERIADLGPAAAEYQDTDPRRGVSYYYYITAYNDGSGNATGETNPTGELESSRFYTRTTEPAFLQRAPGRSLDEIRVVPNPYNIRARHLQYPGEPDKIMFLNIPGQCTIRIYTERGDLIETIHHTDGSGDATWQSITSSRQIIVSGVYIAHFTVTEDQIDSDTGELLFRAGDSQFRKFVVIR
jgi:hypothetical protein